MRLIGLPDNFSEFVQIDVAAGDDCHNLSITGTA
jgi:hypothetical protein